MKPKRYRRARSQMHARVLKAAGHSPRKIFNQSTELIGPYSPTVMCECICHRAGWDDQWAAEVLDALTVAADGHVVRINGRLIARPAGAGRVTLELPRGCL